MIYGFRERETPRAAYRSQGHCSRYIDFLEGTLNTSSLGLGYLFSCWLLRPLQSKKSPTALEDHSSTFPNPKFTDGETNQDHRGKGTCPRSHGRRKARTRVSAFPGQELLGLWALSLPAFSPILLPWRKISQTLQGSLWRRLCLSVS